MNETPGSSRETESVSGADPVAGESHHAWYDDDFCPGGGRFVGETASQVACPVCGEMMDVDEHGNLFKHRPHIPKNVG
jgi:hypothetical protein